MRGIERSEMAPCNSAHFRKAPNDCSAFRTFEAISLRSIPLIRPFGPPSPARGEGVSVTSPRAALRLRRRFWLRRSRAQPDQMADREDEIGAVHRIEVQLGDAAID